MTDETLMMQDSTLVRVVTRNVGGEWETYLAHRFVGVENDFLPEWAASMTTAFLYSDRPGILAAHQAIVRRAQDHRRAHSRIGM